MQKIFIEKPYRFVPPMMSDWFAKLMNNWLIHTTLLRFTQSIVQIESHGVELLKKSIDDGHAVMMIPNHPRISDPLAMYNLIRHAKTPMFAMASWHLFNQSKLDTAIIRMYGGYSVNREGLDRESINFSISSLQNNRRPLLVFPEGATSRTNDSMMPFLDGPTFIARTAARRRKKEGLKTVIHPIVIRYLFIGDFEKELNRMMDPVEKQLNLPSGKSLEPVVRVRRSLDAIVAKREQEFGVDPDDSLSPFDRRHRLADSVMATAEQRCFGERSEKDFTNRIRDIRSLVFPEILANKNQAEEKLSAEDVKIRWRDLERTYLAWQMTTYPEDYLAGSPSVDRVLEIAAKIFEDLTHTPRKCSRQRVIIKCCEAIEVPPEKHRGPETDPLIPLVMNKLKTELENLP